VSASEAQGAADRRMLEFLVCPVTRGRLDYDAARQELVSRRAGLAFPIQRPGLGGVPVGVAEEAGDLVAVAVEDDRHRQAGHAHRAGELALRVGVGGEGGDAGLLAEGGDRLGGVAAGGDGEDREVVAAALAGERVERRHLAAARRAPGGPEVDDPEPAVRLGEGRRRSVGGEEGDVGRRHRLGEHHELAHVALAEGVERQALLGAEPAGGGGVCEGAERGV
jgi:uncharacterized protein YbaR (Trm112 family)